MSLRVWILVAGLVSGFVTPHRVVAQTCLQWGAPWPTARSEHAMAYDSRRNVTVLFGGYDGLRRGDIDVQDLAARCNDLLLKINVRLFGRPYDGLRLRAEVNGKAVELRVRGSVARTRLPDRAACRR